jgi:hypothetical protein
MGRAVLYAPTIFSVRVERSKTMKKCLFLFLFLVSLIMASVIHASEDDLALITGYSALMGQALGKNDSTEAHRLATKVGRLVPAAAKQESVSVDQFLAEYENGARLSVSLTQQMHGAGKVRPLHVYPLLDECINIIHKGAKGPNLVR